MSDTTTSIPLLRARPGDVGVPVAAVHAVLDGFEAGGLEMHSLMVVRHGHVAAEGWWARRCTWDGPCRSRSCT